jgi:hypothetical protein
MASSKKDDDFEVQPSPTNVLVKKKKNYLGKIC